MPAAAAIVIFVAGAALGVGSTHLLPRTEVAGGDESAATPDGWRAVVAEYLTLYTRDTLANLPDDRSLHEAELKSVGDKLALGLSVDKVALDGLVLKRSQLFNLDGRPLAQIAYLTSDDGPVAFCIIADGGQGPGAQLRRAARQKHRLLVEGRPRFHADRQPLAQHAGNPRRLARCPRRLRIPPFPCPKIASPWRPGISSASRNCSVIVSLSGSILLRSLP